MPDKVESVLMHELESSFHLTHPYLLVLVFLKINIFLKTYKFIHIKGFNFSIRNGIIALFSISDEPNIYENKTLFLNKMICNIGSNRNTSVLGLLLLLFN